MNTSIEKFQINGFLDQVSQEYNKLVFEYAEELDSIRGRNLALFPDNFLLSKEQTDTYRALCTLSQSGISKNLNISSHRRYIGPIIVFFKKILNRIIDAQFRNQFLGVEACMSRLITNQAKLEIELKLSQSEQMNERES